MANYYDELLRICGFEVEEIAKERTRIEKVFDRIELGPEDMKTAESWVSENHDIELVGVRKLLGVWLKEFIDMVLAKDEGKKVVYYGFPAIPLIGMLINAASEKIYCACPDVVVCHTMGQIFKKLDPLLEMGEESGLPPGHAMCSLQQVRVGGMAKGIIPIPDLIITSGYFCDMGSKTDELLQERYGQPTIYVDNCMDSRWGEYPDYLPQRVEYLGAQLNNVFDGIKEILGVEVTRDAWDKAMSIGHQLYSDLSQLTRLMKADPMPVSSTAAELMLSLPTGSAGRGMAEGHEAVSILIQELKKRIDEGIGVVEKGAPKVVCMVYNFSDPRITRMIENAGLAVFASVFFAPPPKVEITSATIGEKLAERELQFGLIHSAYSMVKRAAVAIEDLDADGCIWNYQYSCRPLATTPHLFKKWVEENTGVPVLSLESDFFETRSHSAGALRTRVETFADMLRDRKASTGER